MKVGINSLAYSIPKIYLPIETLANMRDIEPPKLIKGLGLQKMTLLDHHQDVVCLAANAVLKLINDNNIPLNKISRIYVGTESGVDSSKPIGSYLISMLEQHIEVDALKNCDVLDITFACIGGVDALQNCIDYITLNPEEKAIVVTTDFAKYDLASTGEYTQGAGAIAMEISANPAILAFDNKVGTSTQGVFDFFKPRRTFQKESITSNPNNEEWNGILENEITIYKEQPVFDGQYSNQCYIDRIVDSYENFKAKSNKEGKVYQDWKFICMHLPYAYQGRRTFIEIFANENIDLLNAQAGEDLKEKKKSLTKSNEYMQLVNEKILPSEIASSQIGNIYTGSIFLGLISSLGHALKNNENLDGHKIGFIAYGSGSKSKTFEGVVQTSWKEKISKLSIFEELQDLKAIESDQYLSLHKKESESSIIPPSNEFVLDGIETSEPNLIGARYYSYR